MTTPVEVVSSDSRDERSLGHGTIVIATDGRPECTSVVAGGRALAARLGAKVRIVAVCRPLAPVLPDRHMLLDLAMIPKLRAEIAHRVRRQCTLDAPSDSEIESLHLEVRDGEPAAVIARASDERETRLIVLGLGRHEIVDRIFGDETALKVVRAAHVPVLAVPETPFHALHSAVVGVDFSEMSVRAAQAALELLDDGAIVRFVHVVPKTRTIIDTVIPDDEQQRYLRHCFTQLVSRLTIPPTIAIGEVTLEGDPARELLAYAAAMQADVVAVGSHGHDFVERLVLGSVTTKLLRAAAVAVLVVPPEQSGHRARHFPVHGLTTRYNEARWAEVLDDFTRSNLGRDTRLEVDDPELGAQPQEQDCRLLGVAYDPHDQRVEIMLGELGRGEPHLARSIAGVDALHVLRDIDGRDLALHLRHGNSQTILTLLR